MNFLIRRSGTSFFRDCLPALRGGDLKGVAAEESPSTDMTSLSVRASSSPAVEAAVVGAARLLARLPLFSLSERKHVGQLASLG